MQLSDLFTACPEFFRCWFTLFGKATSEQKCRLNLNSVLAVTDTLSALQPDRMNYP